MLGSQRCCLTSMRHVWKFTAYSEARNVHGCAARRPNATWNNFRRVTPGAAWADRRNNRSFATKRASDFSGLTTKELSAKLKKLGLPVSGRKQELIDRLNQHAPAPAKRTRQKADASSASTVPASVDAADALQYEKKSPVEHILLRPDSYVGSTKPTERRLVVYNLKDNVLEYRDVRFIPAILKIFDEILVNAADNKQRDPSMQTLDVRIDARLGTISILNDGQGIPVVMHPKHKVYVPELIMGNLLTGSNFDDSKSRITGGRHGYG